MKTGMLDQAAQDRRHQAEAVLRRIGRSGDTELPIAEGALALASLDRPEVDLAAYHEHLEALGAPIVVEGTGNAARIQALARRFGDLFGYQGDNETYDDLENANLIGVIDRRRGLPVALGILYMHVARAQGWGMCGLSFPGHFLLRLEAEGERSVLDPFHGGRSLTPPALRALFREVTGHDGMTPGHCAAVSDLQVLARLQNNVKIRHLRASHLPEALAVIESMLLFVEGAELWREAGLVQARLGSLKAAREALSKALDMDPLSPNAAEIRTLLKSLGRQLN